MFSPFHLACHVPHHHVRRFLIEKGADVNHIAWSSRTSEAGNVLKAANRLSWKDGFRWTRDFPDSTPLNVLYQSGLGHTEVRFYCAIMLINAGAKLSVSHAGDAASGVILDLIHMANLTGVFLDSGGIPRKLALDLLCWRAGSNRLHEIAAWFLEKGAVLRGMEVYSSIGVGDWGLVNLLLKHGALLAGGEVCKAITLGRWDLVELLLIHGAPVGSAEIVVAVRNRQWDLVDFLFRCGKIPASITNKFEKIAFEMAILSQDIVGVARLLEISPDLYDVCSLCAAISVRNNTAIRRLLANRRAEWVTYDLEVTAIGMAAESGNLGLLQSILEVPTSYKSGPMPLDGFLKRQKNVSTHSYQLKGSPLVLVAGLEMDQDVEACSELLLQKGFEPDGLTWAVIVDSNNLNFAQFLLKHDLRYDGEYEDSTRLYLKVSPFIRAVKRRNKEFVGMLLSAGADVNEKDKRKPKGDRSPLQLAVELGDSEMVQYLVEAGANINSPATFWAGATALQLAAIKGHLGLAKYLLDSGAEVNSLPAQIEARTALEGAAEWGRLDMLELLLANGAHKTGDLHQYFVKAVGRALYQGHYTAANFLKHSLGWSEEDEALYRNQDDESLHPDIGMW